MTDLLNDADTPSDAELISRVRGGDVTAYGTLFSRHRDAANRLARQLVRGPDSDDLVSEAFAKVLVILQGGGGPDVSFRAYLLTAVRRLHVDRLRSGKRLQTTDDLTPFDPGVPFQDTAVAGFESGAAAKAFASLPERWQLVLWHLEVEGQKPSDIAPLLGMSPNSVSALAYRAREGLRQAFLTMHLSDISEDDCRWVNEHLGAFVRKGLAKRDATRVQSHLDDCRRCTAMHLELTEVNSDLRGIIAPLLLGSAAAGYLASTGGAGILGGLTVVSRARDLAAANSGGVVAAAVSVGVAAAAVLAVVLTQGGNKPDVVADPPAVVTSAPTDAASRAPSSLTTRPASGATRTKRPRSTARPSATGSRPAVPRPTASPDGGTTPSSGLTPGPTSTPPTTSSSSPRATGSPHRPGSRPTRSARPSTRPSRPAPTTAPPLGTPAAPALPDRVVRAPVVAADGSVTVSARHLRDPDVLDVTMVSADTTFAADQPAGCSTVGPRHVECRPAGQDAYSVALALGFPDSMVEDQLQVTAGVAGVPAATATVTSLFHPLRTPSFHVAAPVLAASPAHRVSADVDQYDFRTTAVLPPRVRGLVYRIGPGARFRAADATPCRVTDPSTMTCPDVRDGDRVDVPVAATLDAALRVALSVSPVVRFSDPDPSARTVVLTLRPGVDLRLSGLDPDNESPANDDNEHLVAARLSGLRPGVSQVSYTLAGAATFVCAARDTCSTDGRTLTGDRPADGDLTFRVRADDPHAETPISLSVRAAGAYEELDDADNTARTRLAPRPTYDFSMGALSLVDQSLTGATDRYTLRSTVGAVPDGLTSLDLGVTGGTFAADQPTGCTRVDLSTVSCADLGTARPVDLRVDSTVDTAHAVTVALRPPHGYDDPGPGNDDSTVTVSPGVDLHVGALAPADPTPVADTYRISSVLSGTRSGAVTYTVSAGVTVVGAGCPVTGDREVVCASPPEGRTVWFALRPDHPSAGAEVTLTAAPAAALVELDAADNTTGIRLSPDVSLDALTVLRHRAANQQVVVRAQVSGAPSTMDALRIRVSGAPADAGQVHLTDGVGGADGQDAVDCYTSDADGRRVEEGLYATCTGIAAATDGAFFVDLRLAHPHGTSSPVTLSVVPIAVDEGPHVTNDSRDLTIT